MNLTGFWRGLDRALDPFLAGVLLVVGLADIWVFAPSDFFTLDGSPIPNTLLMVLVCVPLVWRRKSPLSVTAIVVASSYVWVVVSGDLRQPPPFEAFLSLVFVSYTLGSRLGGRRLLVGLGTMLFGFVADVALFRAGKPAGDTFPAWVFFALAFAAGRIVHSQRSLAAELAQRASELEIEREERARMEVAVERARIARELHDVVTHNVSLMVIQASVERRMLSPGSESAEVLASIEETGRQTLGELRRVLGFLRANDDRAPLSPQPSIAALPELFEGVGIAGLPVEFVVAGTQEPLAAGIEMCAFRVIQEALTNTLRHARATSARVRLEYRSGVLELEVTDDGSGSAAAARFGRGLDGMRERVELYGGELEAGMRSESPGFRVLARLPTCDERQ